MPHRKAQLFCIVYLLFVVGYSLYSVGASTGLGGYLAYLQLKYFDSAQDILTIPIMVVLLVIPGFAILTLILSFAPSLSNSTEVIPDPIEIATPKEIPLKWAAAVVLGIGAIISAVLLVNQTTEKNEKVYDIVLDEHPAVPPQGAKFVQVTGVPSSRFRGVYKETDRAYHVWTYIYVAVTREGWNTGDPVRYFALYEPREGRASLPSGFLARDAQKFAGRIGGALPVAIRRKFESEGLKIEPSYFVINYGDPGRGRFPLLASSRICRRSNSSSGDSCGCNVVREPPQGPQAQRSGVVLRCRVKESSLLWCSLKGNMIEIPIGSNQTQHASLVNAVIAKTGGIVSEFFDGLNYTYTTSILLARESLRVSTNLSRLQLEWIGKDLQQLETIAEWLRAEIEKIRTNQEDIQTFNWTFRTTLSDDRVCSAIAMGILEYECQRELSGNEFRIRLLSRRYSGQSLQLSDRVLQLSRSRDGDTFKGQFTYSPILLENINYHLALRNRILKLLGSPADCRSMTYTASDDHPDYIRYEDLGIRE